MSWSVAVTDEEKGSLGDALDKQAGDNHLEGDAFEQYQAARDAALDLADSLAGPRVTATLSGHVGDGSQTNRSSVSVYLSEA